MEQKIEYIDIKNLVLWTENPRDPIDEKVTDQDIVNRALEDIKQKWNLLKLAKEMGEYYDFSELPTVVYHEQKPVVYDGNRRIILAKIKFGLVNLPSINDLKLPDFPEKIPCNVCSKEIALNNVFRKHGNSGTWQPLERDIFLHKFMGEKKSVFLTLDEQTSIITNNPDLNKRYVKDEIFTENNLKELGFNFQNGSLNSIHSEEESIKILNEVIVKIKNKDITTRKNRGKITDILEPNTKQLIEQNKNNPPRSFNIINNKKNDSEKVQNSTPKISKRNFKKNSELFGGKLYLKEGEVNNIYRDIIDLYYFYLSNKNRLSQSFPSIIRMSLRLLCETAAKDINKKLESYINDYFDNAKIKLNQDQKTTLSNYNINKSSAIQLLHTGAHSYQSSSNIEQTIALSIIIGSILKNSHGKNSTL